MHQTVVFGRKLKKLSPEIVKKNAHLWIHFLELSFNYASEQTLFRIWWVSKLRLSVNFSAFTGVFTKLTHKHKIKIPSVGLMLLLFSLDLARKIWNEKYSTNILDSCIEYSFTALYLIILNFFVQNFTDGNEIPQEFRPEFYSIVWLKKNYYCIV